MTSPGYHLQASERAQRALSGSPPLPPALHPLPFRPNAYQLFCSLSSSPMDNPAGPGGGSGFQSRSPGWPGPLWMAGNFSISLCFQLGRAPRGKSEGLIWPQGRRKGHLLGADWSQALLPWAWPPGSHTSQHLGPSALCVGLAHQGFYSSSWFIP